MENIAQLGKEGTLRLLCAVVIVGFLIGCGGGGKGGKGGGAGSSGTIPPKPKSATTVDHNGGKVAVSDPVSPIDGASIDIPAGALTQPTTITINPIQNTSPIMGALPIDFGPDGTTFAVPVTITVPYTDTLIQEYDEDPQDLLVFSHRASGDFDVDTVQSINQTQRRVTATTTHFSKKEAKFGRHYLFFDQPRTLFDSTPAPYKITTRHVLMPGGMQTQYYPVIVYDAIPATIPLGKGTLTNFWSSVQRNVIIIHGLQSSPPTLLFSDDVVKVYKDGLLWTLRTHTAFDLYDNIVLYQYPSGVAVAENAKWLADTVKKNTQAGFKTDIIAHSMGGVVARSAIEQFGLSPYIERLITLGSPHEGGQLNSFTTFITDTKITINNVERYFPGISDIIAGRPFLDDSQTGLNTQFAFSKIVPTGYYLIVGKTTPTSDNDGLVKETSAAPQYLVATPNHAATFTNVEHSELHTKARTNGVLMKIREWVTGKPNATPIANAGQDQTVTVNTQVTLAGSATDADQDTLTYAWTQTAGPNVTLANANTATAMFTPTQTGTYTFTLTASDTVATGTDTVTITVVPGNGTPVANAGADRTVTIGVLVSLDGSGSSDPDNNPLTYRWIQMAGTSVVLSNAKTVSPTFVPSSADTYTFSLIVNDGNVDSAIDTVTITVNPPPINRATFYPVVDTYTGDQAYNSANPNRATLPSFLIGDDGAGQNFWGRVSFDPVSTIVPPNVTITKATFTLHEKTVWRGGEVSIEVGGGVWVYRPTGGSSDIDVTKEFQTLLSSASAGLPLFSFLITSPYSNSINAHLEYHSSEGSTATTPSFTIEWQ